MTEFGRALDTLVRSFQSFIRDNSSHRGGYGGRGREPRPQTGTFQRHPRSDYSNDTRQQAPTQEPFRPRAQYQPTDQRRAAQVNSDNPDFRELIKTMNQGARLYHAQNHWESLPITLDKAVDRISSSVRPPMPDETLSRHITRAANSFKEAIRHSVNEHLVRKSTQTRRTLQQLDPQDENQAKSIVRRQLLRTNGRMTPSMADELLNTVSLDLGGHNNHRWQDPPGGGARPPPPPQDQTITIQNRFQILQDMDTMDLPEEDPEPMPPRQTRRKAISPTGELETPKRTKRGLEEHFAIPTGVPPSINTMGSAGPQPTSAHPVPSTSTADVEQTSPETDRRPPTPAVTPTMPPNIRPRLSIFFRDRKQDWAIPEVRDDEDILFLTDSNGRNLARFTPSNWRVACYSGATINHAREILQRTPLPTQVKRILIAVGINDRENLNPTTMNSITRLKETLTLYRRQATILGIPHFAGEPNDITNATKSLNNTFADLFGADFIPLPAEFHATPAKENDQYHYSTGTAHTLVSILATAVDALN